jgi:hypothetical protein
MKITAPSYWFVICCVVMTGVMKNSSLFCSQTKLCRRQWRKGNVRNVTDTWTDTWAEEFGKYTEKRWSWMTSKSAGLKVIKNNGGAEVWLYSFLPSAIHAVNSHLYYPVALLRRKSAQNPSNRSLHGPQGRSGQSGVEKTPCCTRQSSPYSSVV